MRGPRLLDAVFNRGAPVPVVQEGDEGHPMMGYLRHDEAAAMARSLQPFLAKSSADPQVRAGVEQVADWCTYLTGDEFTPSRNPTGFRPAFLRFPP